MGDDHYIVSHRIVNAVSAAGGVPVTPLDIRRIKEYAGFADGLLLTDGPCIHLARCGGICPDWTRCFRNLPEAVCCAEEVIFDPWPKTY